MNRVAATTLAVCGSAWVAMTGPADADQRLRVLVVGGERDAALVTRVEGQVADVAATLEHEPAPMPDAPLPVQLVSARRLARAHRADVVVWFAQDGGDVIVHVTDTGADRVLVRRVEAGGGTMSASAAYESAAMIVRTAVRGLAAGGEIGVAAARTSIPDDGDAPTPPRRNRDGDRDDELGAVRPLRPSATVGWSGVLDGESATGHHGISARLGVAGGPWHVAVALTHRPPTSLDSAMATIDVERQTLGVALGVDVAGGAQLRRGGRWRVNVEVAAAMTRFGRTTTLTGTLVEPTADRATWSPTATPAVRVARRVARGAWLELSLGVDLVARAPDFGIATPQGFTSIGRLWPIEPHAGLGVVVDPF